MALKEQDWFYSTCHYRAGASRNGCERVLLAAVSLPNPSGFAVTELLRASRKTLGDQLGSRWIVLGGC